MKMFLLVLSMLPVMAMASSDEFDIPGAPVSDSQLSEITGGLGRKCAKFSDMWCFGKVPGSLCVSDPRSGRSGFCNQRDQPDRNGNVSCSCF